MGVCANKASYIQPNTISKKNKSINQATNLHIQKIFEFSSKEIEGKSTTVLDSQIKIESYEATKIRQLQMRNRVDNLSQKKVEIQDNVYLEDNRESFTISELAQMYKPMFDLKVKYTPVDMNNQVLFANDIDRRSFVQNGHINGFKNNDKKRVFTKQQQF